MHGTYGGGARRRLGDPDYDDNFNDRYDGYDDRDRRDDRDRYDDDHYGDRGRSSMAGGGRPPTGQNARRDRGFAATQYPGGRRDDGFEDDFAGQRLGSQRRRQGTGQAAGRHHEWNALSAEERRKRGRPTRRAGKKTNQFREACQLLQLVGAPAKRVADAVQPRAGGRYGGGQSGSVREIREDLRHSLRPPSHGEHGSSLEGAKIMSR